MNIDFSSIFNEMAQNAAQVVEEGGEQLGSEIHRFMERNQDSIAELTTALANGEISQDEYEQELSREQYVLEAELIGMEIQAKSAIQKAVNAAMQVLTSAVKASL